MTAADFARIALSFDGAEQGAHMGATDSRVGGPRACHAPLRAVVKLHLASFR